MEGEADIYQKTDMEHVLMVLEKLSGSSILLELTIHLLCPLKLDGAGVVPVLLDFEGVGVPGPPY